MQVEGVQKRRRPNKETRIEVNGALASFPHDWTQYSGQAFTGI